MDSHPNWFQTDGFLNFETHLKPLNSNSLRLLQIGAYTGDASLWMVDSIMSNPDCVLVDVDTWEGSEEPVHYEMNWHTVESLYDAKTAAGRANKKIIKYKGTSDEFFKNNREMYDFIYIDGDHTAYGVLKDAVAAFECLNGGGILAFDDYEWSAGLGPRKEPKMAIDAFSNIYGDRVKEILKGYQRWFKKIG
jgi:predicted O-methyltransferase YrrM